MRSSRAEEIAIIGMGCRFPGGASTPEAYWDLLKNGRDATCEVPADRWSLRRFHDPDNRVAGKILTARGGYLREQVRAFDANFFGISPREAAPMDPQQRLLLEVCWEAFEDAGIPAEQLRGTRTGVYMGGFTTDNLLHQLNGLNLEAISSHTAVSATLVMLSNRLSHVFDLRGPSVTVDTACSSSLVALHLAVQALRVGDCRMALAGGVSVMFRPAYGVAMSKGGFLSPDGRCKSFDASGDGYGRGEGAGLLVLKLLEDAVRDGDRIHGVVVETGVNQDGRTDGITVPSAEAQRALIQEVYARAGVDRDAVAYVEAHGTGTKAGDGVELTSLSQAIAQGRDPSLGPLLVGSAKSNIGHLEAAAGVAGVIKTVLALRHGVIPPSLHFKSPPPGLDLAEMGLQVAATGQAWPAGPAERLASVNSFGYGGTNAHAVLRAAPPPEPVAEATSERPWLLPLSARSERALGRQVRRLHQVLTDTPQLSLRDLGYTLARRRTHMPYRTAILARTVEEACARLRDVANFAAGDLRPVSAALDRASVPLAFVYTGMGSQSWGMGRGLIAGEPRAAEALAACDAIWRDLAGWSLTDLFARADAAPMTEPKFAQPANFAVQVMLTELARGHGLHPTAVIGHSAGEMAAAWAAGALSLEQALTVTWHRSRWQQTCDGQGRMLAVGLALGALPADVRDGLDIAALNGPNAVVLAGDAPAIAAAAQKLQAMGVFQKLLPVNIAYHSAQMEPLKAGFLQSLAGLQPRAPTLPLYSTVTGARIAGAEQDAHYWWRNLRQTVLFAPALQQMIADGVTLFQEIGPHPALAGAILEGLRAAGVSGACTPSLRRGCDDLALAREGIAAGYIHGAAFDWRALYPAGNLVPLLPYAWDREDLWVETALSKADRLGQGEHPFIGRRVGEATAVWEGDFKRVEHAYLQDHCIAGEPIFPAAGYVELALVARADKTQSALMEDLRIHRALATFATPIVRMHLDEEGRGFSIFCRENQPDTPWVRVASGALLRTPVPPREAVIDGAAIKERCPLPLDVPGFYATAAGFGIAYGPAFRCIRAGWMGENECLVRLELPPEEVGAAQSYFVHPVLLDGALQSVLALLLLGAAPAPFALPVGFDQLRFHGMLGATAWCHTQKTGAGIALRLFNDQGAVLLELYGLRLKPAELGQSAPLARRERLYTTFWKEQPLPPVLPQARRRCLVFADRSGIAAALASGEGRAHLDLVLIAPDAVSPAGERGELARQLKAIDLTTVAEILYLAPLDLDDSLSGDANQIIGRDACLTLLYILQSVAALETDTPPAVTVCTCGTQWVVDTDTGFSAPGQEALWGAVRAARREMPEVRFRLIDLASRLPSVAGPQVLAELLAPKGEPEIAYRLGRRHVGRIAPLPQERYAAHPSVAGESYAFTSFQRGGVSKRCLVSQEPRAPGPGEVAIAVISIGLGATQRQGLRDLKPGQVPQFAQQWVGRVVALGAAVTDLVLGQRVLAFGAVSPLASHGVVPADQVLPCPPSFADDDGGGLFDALTAYYALFDLAKMQPGQWLLVPQAGADTALAAVLLARQAGVQVIATADTEADQLFLERCGCAYVLDGATLSFRDRVLALTDQRGVDAAFSGLTGEARLATLDCLTPGGVHLDLCPIPADSADAIPVRYLERDLTILRVRLDSALRRHPQAVRAALGAVGDRFQGALREAFPVHVVPAKGLEHLLTVTTSDAPPGRTALRMDAPGAPVRTAQPQLALDPDATYLVTGGFGGIGLPVLRWLATCGARHLAVIGRSGPASAAAQALVSELGAAGVHLRFEPADMARADQLAAALARLRARMPALKGIIHGAGGLADGSLATMDADRLDQAMAAKAHGALNLHRLVQDLPLDFFVCHGSIAASWGNAGQFNYAGANGFLAGLMRYRRAMGLPGACINWGPIAEAGMAARDAAVLRHLARLGLEPLPQAQMIDILQDAIVENWATCDAADISWQTWQGSLNLDERRRIADLVAGDASSASAAETFRQSLAGLGFKEKRAAIFSLLVEIVAAILKITKSRIDAALSLSDLGTDSLMAAEMAEVLHQRMGVRPRVLFLISSPSLLTLAETLEGELQSA
ncbi:SDR family NAD(P)-dependent oxidoreductase [Azorhizobium sp. AG788]|uniref:type I polyketide synthase n=1 Tax=Azorhizobium sp. AG788 TaxID=2183897 RepID=UPI00313866D6